MLSVILISCLGIIVYSNTFHCPFHFDDSYNIFENSFIKNIHDPLGIWNFYPCRFFTSLSIAFNYHLQGLNVTGYHLFNLGVHLATAVLVWWLTLLTLSTPAMKEDKITGHANLIALLAGLVFVSHPLQTEAVTYIYQRAASMAALFYLASLCLYVKSRLLCHCEERSDEAIFIKNIYYTGAVITAVMAMFTKENTVTLPLMILLYEFCFLKTKGSFNWRRSIPFLFTLFIIPLTMVLTKSARFQEVEGVMQGPHGISPLQYLLTQFRVMMTYIRLVFLPFNQNLDYDYPVFNSIFALPVLTSFLFLMAIFFGAIRLFSKYRLISFAIFWFFLTLLPESSLLPFKDIIFEHRLYLPLAGYSIFLVSGVYYLCGKDSIKMMVIVLSLVIACNSVLTYQRNKIWQDDFILWNDTVGKSPDKARPYYNRGNVYYKKGNIPAAIADYNKAIELDPTFAGSYNNRGLIYDKQGNMTAAIADYNKAIEVNPKLAMPYHDRGLIFAKQGKLIQAMSDFNKAIELDPDMQEAYNDRGNVYYKQGNLTQAISDFTKAIEINPNFTQAYDNRAVVYQKLKEFDGAIKEP